MKIKYSEMLEFDDGYKFEDLINSQSFLSDSADIFSSIKKQLSQFEQLHTVKETIYLDKKEIKPVSISKLHSSKGSDGSYHAIYIQIDHTSGEYYIGKVNRKKWSELKRYQGSGVKFSAKFNKHKDRYARYYLYICDSEKESELLEASLVNEKLLKDPFCLNIVKGGGGVANKPLPEERKARQSAYMKEHPERYINMLQAARNFDARQIMNRNKKIKETMSTNEYKEMSSKRIKEWAKNNPIDYEKSRKNNAKSVADPEVQRKRLETLRVKAKENPELYKQRIEKWKQAIQNSSARKKRAESLKKFIEEHPEAILERSRKAGLKKRKPILMIDIETGKILMEFTGAVEAAQWLKEKGATKSINPSSAITAACQLKKIPGHGIKKTAYGYKWKYKD